MAFIVTENLQWNGYEGRVLNHQESSQSDKSPSLMEFRSRRKKATESRPSTKITGPKMEKELDISNE